VTAWLARLRRTVRRRLRRVPVRLQLTATECAAACLAMIASFHGRFTVVSECRLDRSTGRDGLSVDQICRIAARLGLAGTVGTELPPGPPAPLVVFYQRRHFMVLERLGPRWARVVDPVSGRRRIDRAEFDAGYSGVFVVLRPTAGFAIRRSRLRDSPMARYLREVLSVPGSRRPMLAILAAAAMLQLLGFGLPLATGYAVDAVLPGHRWGLVPLLAAAAAGTAFGQGVGTLVRGRLLVGLRARANAVLTKGFLAHLLRLPVSFFLHRPRGDLLMRLDSVASAREALTGQLFTLLLDSGMLGIYAAGLALLSPAYAGVTLLLGGVQVAVLAATYRRLRLLAQRELAATTQEQSYLVETLDAVLPLKANSAEGAVLRHWQELFDRRQQATVHLGRTGATLEAAHSGLRALTPLVLLLLGVVLVLRGELSLGAMLAASALAASTLAPLATFVSVGQSFQLVQAQIERMYDVLDSPVEHQGSRRLAGRAPVRVEVDGVGFGYEPDVPVLHDLQLTVPAGGKVGVVGRTGSGKSTLALLVLGLVRPTSGQVRIDGIPLDELDLGLLRHGFGAVLQNLSLFNGSVRDNIVLGRPDATDADVVHAALIAGLHEDVMAMPMRYATQVGEGGLALSAGQRQRVALARAVVHRPRLLVLDEATSQLDPATERRVDEALNGLEVTRLVISHRRSAVENADEIVVLDGGRVVERGRHADLRVAGGRYAEFFGAPAFVGGPVHDRQRPTGVQLSQPPREGVKAP
jgi:ATP-binding cassette, subfamily B, bacterial